MTTNSLENETRTGVAGLIKKAAKIALPVLVLATATPSDAAGEWSTQRAMKFVKVHGKPSKSFLSNNTKYVFYAEKKISTSLTIQQKALLNCTGLAM